MTEDHDGDALTRATQMLRRHTDAGWTAASADILHRALRAFRPSDPVRGRHELGDFFVASDVVVGRLRGAVDTVPGATAVRITCGTDRDHRLDTVTIELAVAYGAHLLTLADQVHRDAARALADVLGDLTPPRTAIHAHVHIRDVIDDPRDVF